MNLTHSHPEYLPIAHRDWVREALLAAIVIELLCLVFAVDRATGSAPLQHLYYVPILFAGLWFRRWGSLMAAGAAIVLYHLANPHLLSFRYEESDVVQMALFVAVGLVTARLTQDAQRLRALASTDDLTGLHNLRSFEAHLATIVRAARIGGSPVSLLVLDVDRLKSMNDRYGHLSGAEAVRRVGRIIAETVPLDAVACRYGGDEFVVALPHCGDARAQEIAGLLRQRVHEEAPTLAGISFPAGTLSISVGVASRKMRGNVRSALSGDDEAGEALFLAADKALYAAKRSGRNYVSVA
jgi:diguanylate cyclase (GGDEF)-like protein